MFNNFNPGFQIASFWNDADAMTQRNDTETDAWYIFKRSDFTRNESLHNHLRSPTSDTYIRYRLKRLSISSKAILAATKGCCLPPVIESIINLKILSTSTLSGLIKDFE